MILKSSRCKISEIEDKLVCFIELDQSAKLPVTKDLIKQIYLLFIENILRRENFDERTLADFEKFTASVVCCVKFEKRHGLRTRALQGKAGISNVEEAAEDMAKLSDRLRKYITDCIVNVD